MHSPPGWLLLSMASFAVIAGEAAASITGPPARMVGGTGAERGVARVVCERRETDEVARVRAVVLDLGSDEPQHEVLLAPAHVLPQDRRRITKDCRIDGRALVKIEKYWLPPADLEGFGADWVILMTQSGLRSGIRRLRVAPVADRTLDGLIGTDRAVGVLLATPEADQRDCRILGRHEPAVFYHSCRAWAGISGAPIIVGVDGEPIVIGFDVAKRMRPLDRPGPLFIGVGRAIDEPIVAAIREAAAAARSAER